MDEGQASGREMSPPLLETYMVRRLPARVRMDYHKLRGRARHFVIGSFILAFVTFSTGILLAAVFLKGPWPGAIFAAMVVLLFSLPFLFKHWLVRAVGRSGVGKLGQYHGDREYPEVHFGGLVQDLASNRGWFKSWHGGLPPNLASGSEPD